MDNRKSERAPWGNFPDLVRNANLGDLSKQPEYTAAKAGDKAAALAIAERQLTTESVEQIRAIIGDRKPLVMPVRAVEASGTNMIPLAFATVLADRLGLEVGKGVGQADRVFRTDSGADHRLAFNPSFRGEVEPGREYIVVDDTLTMGGTLAALRGYLENRGGSVLCAFAATAHVGAVKMPVKQAMLDGIEKKHGSAMNDMWMEEFGYGIDQLTQGEAGHLKAAASVEAMRVRLHDARAGFGRGVDAERAQTAQEAGAGVNVGDVIAKASHAPLPTSSFPSAAELTQDKAKPRDNDPEP